MPKKIKRKICHACGKTKNIKDFFGESLMPIADKIKSILGWIMKLDIGDVLEIQDALNQYPDIKHFEVRYIGNGYYGLFGVDEWMREDSQMQYWGNYFFPWKKWKSFNELDSLWKQEKPDSIYYKINKITRRVKINQIIIEMFSTTKEAVLVDKWFRNYFFPWKKRRVKMNQIIIEMFSTTKEAVLVDKWFGKDIDKPVFKILI